MTDAPPPQPEPDPVVELFRRAQAGDEAAWQELYEQHAGMLLGLLRNRIPPALRARFDTADLLQSVFLQLSNHRAQLQFADAHSLRAWLIRVLMNKFKDRIRQVRSDQDNLREERAPTEIVSQQPGAAPTLDEMASKAELLARMYERILVLDTEDREIVMSRLVDKLTWTEIARRSGLAPATVTKRYNELLEGMVRGFF